MERWHFLYAHFHPQPDWLPLLDWPEVAAGILQLHPGDRPPTGSPRTCTDASGYQHSVLPQGELLSLNALEAALLWCDTQNPKAAQIDDRLLRAIEFIDRDLRADLDVASPGPTAQSLGLPLRPLFRAQLGVTPQQFVERRRLDAACRLLELTTRPISVDRRRGRLHQPALLLHPLPPHTSPAQRSTEAPVGSRLLP